MGGTSGYGGPDVCLASFSSERIHDRSCHHDSASLKDKKMTTAIRLGVARA